MFDRGGVNQIRSLFSGDPTKRVYEYEEGSDDFERLYVKVGDEDVKLHDIPKDVRTHILRQLFISGEALTSENIAEEYVNAGRPKDTNTYDKNIKINMMRGK